jgi:hypothetical protein
MKFIEKFSVHTLHIQFIQQYVWHYIRKAYNSVSRKVLYIILTEFGIPRKQVGLIKMCLNETCSTVHAGKHPSGRCLIHNGLKQGDSLSPFRFSFAVEYAIRRAQEN